VLYWYGGRDYVFMSYGAGTMKIVVVAEGYVEDVISRKGTREAVEAYARGIEQGAGYYGAGGCTCYLKGDDLSDLDADTRLKVARALLGVKRG
jgi:hypothetical protein